MTAEAELKPTGRFDVHSHLLPGVDDGCASMNETIACARKMVAAGYTRSFCTPHFWSSYPRTTVASVTEWTAELQNRFDKANVGLKIYPGAEINLRANLMDSPVSELPTYGMNGKYALIDLWAEKLPKHFEPTIKWMQAAGMTVILAHPERMRAVQDHPNLADYFSKIGLLLQGNLQCFSDPDYADTRKVVEKYLKEDRYFLLGSDLHNEPTMPCRLEGLQRAIHIAGEEKVHRLTVENPQTLLSI